MKLKAAFHKRNGLRISPSNKGPRFKGGGRGTKGRRRIGRKREFSNGGAKVKRQPLKKKGKVSGTAKKGEGPLFLKNLKKKGEPLQLFQVVEIAGLLNG